MAKGFAFTIDATLAAIVFSVFILGVAFLSAEMQKDPYATALAKKQANDILLVLDKSGTLATTSQSIITNMTQAAMDGNSTWRLEVNYYNYSNEFVLVNGFNYTHGANTNGSTEAVSERKFLTFANGTIEYYGSARMTIWTN